VTEPEVVQLTSLRLQKLWAVLRRNKNQTTRTFCHNNVRIQNFSLGGRGGWPWSYIEFMFDFNTYVIKIMLWVQHNTVCNCIYLHKISLHVRWLNNGVLTSCFLNLIIYFSKFQCTSHQPFSVVDFGWRVNHVKLLISSTKICFLNFGFGGLGGAATR
jgi:hypothetical protein